MLSQRGSRNLTRQAHEALPAPMREATQLPAKLARGEPAPTQAGTGPGHRPA
jgi:hypothetical protein